MSEIVYSHRPAAGISVAATNDGPRLLVAFALTNDGTSRNGIMWPKRRDAFSRATARQILRGRLEAMRSAVGPIPMAFVFETPMDARKFIAAFRLLFKPTADESDTLFVEVSSFGGMEFRHRESAENILEKVAFMANGVVADASASV